MKELEKEFTKLGWHHTQVFREGDIAIYKRAKLRGLPAHYEVVKIQSHNGREILGVVYPPAEFYPAESRWGYDAWTFQEYEIAEAKALALVKTAKKDLDAQNQNPITENTHPAL